ncbi:hypothetical protein [Rubrivivax rivuli]|uniref:Uncharacterized protein n=1 Tax=Rubrivivax rivuli TaxID=1862385 RepID=A0A437RLM8_9BURK|nr:hypothetical protein [Rubrivivax rivuli]RVU47654.1 hypothetical protein EOE66_07955 [Rubrivivax rivuli]
MRGPAAAALRLALARSIAWAVHTSGWLVLGALGAQLWPLQFGGLLPTALWLGLLAFVLQAQAGRTLTARTVRAAWLLAAAVLLLASASAQPLWLICSWAAASAASSWTVRLSRGAARTPWRQALVPAAAGVAAGGACGLPALLAGLPAWWPLPALGLMVGGAALTLYRAPARQGCRWGALDEWRALQGLDAAGWRAAWAQADLPQRLSAAAMLPMMAGLPTMLALCTPAGARPLTVVVLHLSAMALPACCAGAWRRIERPWDAALPCAALLIGGGLALTVLPLLQGLMAATLLHTAAWSLAWVRGLQGGVQASLRSTAAVQAVTPRAAALTAAAGVLLLGLALAGLGPMALWLIHAALATLALCWWLTRVWQRRATAAGL